jgi:malonyl-CoA O-methyltransferase
MPNTSSKFGLRRNFARRALSYDRHAGVQRYMAQVLLSLSQTAVGQARAILEIGCGTGYLTLKLRELNRVAFLVALDLDLTLVTKARERLGRHNHTAWLVADGENLAGGSFDLIISNSTFQWFSQPRETLRSYFHRLAPAGFLAFATLGPATFHELVTSLTAIPGLPPNNRPDIPAVRFLGQPHWAVLLQETGFSLLRQERCLHTVTFPTVWDFLKSLQATGATNPDPRPFSPRLLKNLVSAYHTHFAHAAGIPVTYEIIWTLARK